MITVEELVLDAVATACRLERSAFDHRTRLLDIYMDSLTLVAILSQIEAAYDVDLSAADTVDLFRANDVGELITAIEQRISHRREILDESAVNIECSGDRT